MADIKGTHIVSDFKHSSPLISCRFDPSGRYVFAGSQDYQVWRWSITDGKKVALPAADAWVRALGFIDKGQTLVTGGYDGRLLWWDAFSDKPTPKKAIKAHDGWIRAVAISPDQTLIASAGNDLVVKVWDARSGKKIRELKGHQSHIYNVAFHPQGKRLVTGDLKCNLIDWEVATGKKVRSWISKTQIKYDGGFKAFLGGFRGLRFSQDGARLACAGITNVTNAFAGVGNPSVVIYDWKSGKKQVEHLSKQKLKGVAWGVAFHPNGDTIGGIGGGSSHLMFWKPKAKHQFHEVKLPSDVRDLDLHRDGLRLATAHGDRHLRIFKMDTKPKPKKPKK